MSCSRVFSCAFSAQGTLSALRPTMGLRGGAGQRGADVCPPGTSAHRGHHLLRAGGHVRGKGARCVRVPCLLMHQHAVMCALSCSPLPAPALPFLLGVYNTCMSMCVHGCMGVCMREHMCVCTCVAVCGGMCLCAAVWGCCGLCVSVCGCVGCVCVAVCGWLDEPGIEVPTVAVVANVRFENIHSV